MGNGLVIALVISFIIFLVLFKLLKSLVPLVLHGIVGLIVFWLAGYAGILHIPIDWLTFLIAAFGGVAGVVIVIVFSALGIPL